MPIIEQDQDGGRIFFSSTGRTLADEDQICVLSVGVDIGSSTSHLVFSRIVLERLDSRYVVTEREAFYQSDILLTPYAAEDTIDADALGVFIGKQYENAMVDPEEIDAGALILTGVAVRRSNARRIGDDSLETVMAAYGSGAVARSIRDEAVVMNVDVGGGTSKIAVCANGEVIAITAADIGARLVCVDESGRIVRLEEAGRGFATELGLRLGLGDELGDKDARALAAAMADRLFEAMRGGAPKLGAADLLRLDVLPYRGKIDEVTFSGGVAEYIFGWEKAGFGDLGALLGEEIRKRVADWGVRLEKPAEGIRATVIGAAVARLGDLRPARCLLPRRRGRVGVARRQRAADRARRRRRRRRAHWHPFPRGDETRESDRLDRRTRPQGLRLYRHRRDAGELGRGPGRHQVADLPDQRGARARMEEGSGRGGDVIAEFVMAGLVPAIHVFDIARP